MPPQNSEKDVVANVLYASDDYSLVPDDEEEVHMHERKLELNFKGVINDLRYLDYSKVKWINVVAFIFLHSYSVYGLYLAFTQAMWTTLFFAYSLYFLSAMGITMGVHRLWAHRSYKANLPLRIILALCNSLSFQNSIFDWARDHRTHHKYSETDADPHNANRGFFFSHMGWLLYRKHSDVINKGKNLDVSDLLNDPVVSFQRKYYLPSVVLCCFMLPTFIPWYYWGENPITALMIPGFLRYTFTLHITWLVNSLAHWIGSKPYDKNIYPSQNPVVATLALGEGWHNYHHVFPFDYRTAELGGLINLNVTAKVIDAFAKIGWAYDLKTASSDMYRQRVKRTGDGSHLLVKESVKGIKAM